MGLVRPADVFRVSSAIWHHGGGNFCKLNKYCKGFVRNFGPGSSLDSLPGSASAGREGCPLFESWQGSVSFQFN